MSFEITMHPEILENAAEEALAGTVLLLQDDIRKITPRDMDRLPQNINRKDGLAPRRSTYFKPVNIKGNWYMGVSGKLKDSISHQQFDKLEFGVGVGKGPTAEYGKFLEFGTSKMRPRSFLRKGIIDNQAKVAKTFKYLFSKALGKT